MLLGTPLDETLEWQRKVADISPFAVNCEKRVIDEGCGVIHFIHPEDGSVYATYTDNPSGLTCEWWRQLPSGETAILSAHRASKEEARQWHQLLEILTSDCDERVLQ